MTSKTGGKTVLPIAGRLVFPQGSGERYERRCRPWRSGSVCHAPRTVKGPAVTLQAGENYRVIWGSWNLPARADDPSPARGAVTRVVPDAIPNPAKEKAQTRSAAFQLQGRKQFAEQAVSAQSRERLGPFLLAGWAADGMRECGIPGPAEPASDSARPSRRVRNAAVMLVRDHHARRVCERAERTLSASSWPTNNDPSVLVGYSSSDPAVMGAQIEQRSGIHETRAVIGGTADS